ncbi:MAG: hypothetical protein BRC47_14605 [Cyanobacteria bacterium QS_7_48_42]|jgi:tetratricopeptide (TPR) repeat protein|nr:MAG: hypothetical protein BRC35_06575 [Cyanobacteria bacterium QH_10_48_56]PSO63910.1 MAG: hypothetical protein BRC39_03675 [Cyanobacteria bacterium QH_7_48_89]PSO64607.1 MAG: hypothetical protein BRC36_06275 [Cyanobacteria bacterium QH_2_48_84]PSO65516.1 MAG: hypothetical protein BRC38_08645 [Cyanobacteria bacterium QH_6_48_35]PSO69268.1 MAG: hypothetical protein BRC42_12195 [Cyanobacteria bacterium QS_1_48_34]PSO78579.1 MAG: hypothetical protein BRC37_00545 [Cyanobacteria bacterium QH_3_4
MPETSPLLNWLAIAVVGVLVGIVAVLLGKAIATSNLFNRGVKLYQEKDYEQAEAILRTCIERQHSNDMARLLLGDALTKQHKLDEAIAVFEELTARSRKNVDAFLSLGKVLMEKGKLDEAIAQFQKAAAIKPNRFPEPHRALGLALKEQDKTEEAIAALTKARDLYQAQGLNQMVEVSEQDLQQVSVQ